MEKQTNKHERIEIRVSSQDKVIFRKAQKLSGDRSLGSFVVRTVKKQAEDIIASNDRTIASERDRAKFFDTVFGDSEPNQNLVEAARKYQSETVS